VWSISPSLGKYVPYRTVPYALWTCLVHHSSSFSLVLLRDDDDGDDAKGEEELVSQVAVFKDHSGGVSAIDWRVPPDSEVPQYDLVCWSGTGPDRTLRIWSLSDSLIDACDPQLHTTPIPHQQALEPTAVF
jgi:hypothetical protein